jgi:hypothetical protein
MYVVVYKNRVITGPMTWNRAIFQGSLAKQGVQVQLPRVPPAQLPWVISPDAQIMGVEERRPSFDPRLEHLYGPLWTITETHAIADFQVHDNPLWAAQHALKAEVAENRWRQEVAGVKFDLQGSQVHLDTSREGRHVFVQALSLMPDGGTLNWKFPEGWFLITKPELYAMVMAGAAHIQTCFAWERIICDQIDAAQTKQELLQIDLTYPQTESDTPGPAETTS